MEDTRRWIFRDIHERDLPEVISLHEELFPVKYSRKFYDSLLDKNSAGMVTIIMQDLFSETIAGVCTFRIQSTPNSFLKAREGYIATFGIKTDFRRQGLGRNLLEFAIKEMEKVEEIYRVCLHVKTDNDAAIALYKSLGFMIKSRLYNHYMIDNEEHDAFEVEKIIVRERVDVSGSVWSLKSVFSSSRPVSQKPSDHGSCCLM